MADERFGNQLPAGVLKSIFSFFPVVGTLPFKLVNKYWRKNAIEQEETILKYFLNKADLNSRERETLLILLKLKVKRDGAGSLQPLLQRYQANSKNWDVHPLEKQKAELLSRAMQNPEHSMKKLRAESVSLPYALGKTTSLTFYPSAPFGRHIDFFYGAYAETRPSEEKRRKLSKSSELQHTSLTPTLSIGSQE